MKRWPWLLLAFAVHAMAAPSREWNFTVRLDGKPIGMHHFVVNGDGAHRRVEIDAAFVVKFLGLTVYRYQHHASEQWQGDCLSQLKASTDDGGKHTEISAHERDAVLQVDGAAAPQALPGCVMSFAYWNPALRLQTQLLNSQTGKDETVQFTPEPDAEIIVRGSNILAKRWRLTGAGEPIELWYTPAGDWVGLDSHVRGDRLLSYRIEP